MFIGSVNSYETPYIIQSLPGLEMDKLKNNTYVEIITPYGDYVYLYTYKYNRSDGIKRHVKNMEFVKLKFNRKGRRDITDMRELRIYVAYLTYRQRVVGVPIKPIVHSYNDLRIEMQDYTGLSTDIPYPTRLHDGLV